MFWISSKLRVFHAVVYIFVGIFKNIKNVGSRMQETIHFLHTLCILYILFHIALHFKISR